MIRVDALVAHPPPRDAQTRRAGARYGHRWCHLFADTPEELPELHRVAAAIGMRKSWFQNDGDLTHYDLVPPRREAALRSGAVEGTRLELVTALRLFRSKRKVGGVP